MMQRGNIKHEINNTKESCEYQIIKKICPSHADYITLVQLKYDNHITGV
jgi:hypothetical protein